MTYVTFVYRDASFVLEDCWSTGTKYLIHYDISWPNTPTPVNITYIEFNKDAPTKHQG